MTERARLLWTENGIQRQAIAEVRDLSPTGMSCWVSNRIAANTQVRLECHAQRLHGDALVRHCNNHKARFLLGIEFAGGMTWVAPGEAPQRPRWD